MTQKDEKFIYKYKPGVSRRALLFIAGCVWTIAGGILIARGIVAVVHSQHLLFLKFGSALLTGILFYLALFSRISSKHISRIRMIRVDDPCFFSFFNTRSYLLMALMISGGITLRKLEVINPEILFAFFVAMGLPLLFSAYRFFYSWKHNTDIK